MDVYELESCCTSARHYSWDKETCMISGGAPSPTGMSGWYVDHTKDVCVQDCVGGSPCGGLAKKWDIAHASITDCCKNKLNWIQTSTCEAESQGQTPHETFKWYDVDWYKEKCVENCVGCPPCGGLAEPWDYYLYSIPISCCGERLPWVKTADCMP